MSAIHKTAGSQMKIVAEDKVVKRKIETLINNWEKEKPISGELQLDIAMNLMSLFKTCLNQLQEDYTLVCRAKEILDQEHSSSDQLDPAFLLFPRISSKSLLPTK
ncbi:hypothetical protein BY996DRAFT_6423430 [Phakopsora pachyrhizi]|uniref:Uncharacterized protein n=1 Tax=Phakopsora pachyrhizi TaxID=170000 RepID=A0AAV0AFB5_PHAPC|nr:hypothetical protein BY996DRAFT_6423430 [Phakopsora pachyrhizi]CAH7666127.1 hypothetical protein PPACK8108_LOCUS448 [Phakopsora pachyrhizi]